MNLLDALYESNIGVARVLEWNMLITSSGYCLHLGCIEPLGETLGKVNETLKEEKLSCSPVQAG